MTIYNQATVTRHNVLAFPSSTTNTADLGSLEFVTGLDTFLPFLPTSATTPLVGAQALAPSPDLTSCAAGHDIGTGCSSYDLPDFVAAIADEAAAADAQQVVGFTADAQHPASGYKQSHEQSLELPVVPAHQQAQLGGLHRFSQFDRLGQLEQLTSLDLSSSSGFADLPDFPDSMHDSAVRADLPDLADNAEPQQLLEQRAWPDSEDDRYSSDASRSPAVDPDTAASATPSKPPRRRIILTHTEWPPEVLHMSVRDLNKYLKTHEHTQEAIADLRKLRRRLKNRGYAKKTRDKRSLKDVELGNMCTTQMRVKIKRLQQEVDAYRDRSDLLLDLLRQHCPDALSHVPVKVHLPDASS